MKSLIILAALALTPFAAQADPSYTYVEGGFIDVGESGIFASGSFGINEHFYAVGDLYILDNTNQIKFGAGYHRAILDKLDVYGELRYIDFGEITISGFFGSTTVDLGTGFSISGGAIYSINDKFEVEGGLRLYNSDSDSDINPFGEVRYEFMENLSGLFGLELGDGDDIMKFGVRYSF